MHLAEAEAHGRDAGQHAGGNRQQRDGKRAQRCEGEPEQTDHRQRAEHSEPLDLGLDAFACGHAEAAGTRDLEAERCDGVDRALLRSDRRQRRERIANRLQRHLLAVEIGALGARRHHQHGARRNA